MAMDKYTATEMAFKHGYEKGYEAGIAKEKKAYCDGLLDGRRAALEGVPVAKWIPASEPPTRKDADKYGRVLVMELGMMTLVHYLGPINYPDRFPYWMPLPEPPKE